MKTTIQDFKKVSQARADKGLPGNYFDYLQNVRQNDPERFTNYDVAVKAGRERANSYLQPLSDHNAPDFEKKMQDFKDRFNGSSATAEQHFINAAMRDYNVLRMEAKNPAFEADALTNYANASGGKSAYVTASSDDVTVRGYHAAYLKAAWDAYGYQGVNGGPSTDVLNREFWSENKLSTQPNI